MKKNNFSKNKKSKSKSKSKSNKFLIINIICSILLIISIFCFDISPAEYSIMLFLPLLFGVLWLVNFIFLILSLFLGWKKIFISLISLLFSLKILFFIFPISSYFNFSKEKACDFKILTYNVRCFGLYDWENTSIKNNIIKTIADETPDVVCLQEAFWVPKSKNFVTIDSLKLALKYKYDYRFTLANAVGKQNFGLVFVSRFPIIESFGQKFDSSSNGFAYADILKDNDTIRIFNLHLESMRLGENDYETIKTISDTTKTDPSALITLYAKYLKSYKKRILQADIVKKQIDNCKTTKFVCGDFNDFALSYSYHKIKGKNLYDAFLACGSLNDYTWHNNNFKIKIDHIFYDNNYKTKSYKIIKKDFSDHFPIVAEFYRNIK